MNEPTGGRVVIGFVQRELERISSALGGPQSDAHYCQLYAAQQALSWALEPSGFKAPYETILEGAVVPLKGTREADFANKEYRDEFARSFVNGEIASQLKVLREARGLTQAQLAKKAGVKQSRISVMEDVNYSSWNISTLQRLARALDVALLVRFESFGRILRDSDSATASSLAVPSYGADPVFRESCIISE